MERRPQNYTVLSETPGDFDQLQHSSGLARKLRIDYIKKIKSDFDERLAKNERIHSAISANHPEWPPAEAVALSREDYTEEIIHTIRKHGFIPGKSYKFDMTDLLLSEHKHHLFDDPIFSVRKVASSVGISLPSNLIDRIRVIDEESFWGLILWVDGVNEFGSYDSLGFTTNNRLCVINEGAVNNVVTEGMYHFDDIVRNVGIHELWHSLTYREEWKIPGKELQFDNSFLAQLLKRSGIVTNKCIVTSKEDDHTAFRSIDEGIVSILTKQALESIGYTYIEFGNKAESEIVEILIETVGIEPLLRATLMKLGYLEFGRKFNKIYGKGSLRSFSSMLIADIHARSLAKMEGEELPYDSSRHFLETGAINVTYSADKV